MNEDLYRSTTGSFSTGGLNGADEDVLACRGADTGDSSSSCTTQDRAFDGSSHDLNDGNSEDIDAFSFVQGASGGLRVDEGPAFFSTLGAYDAGTAVGGQSDLFSCDVEPADFTAACGVTVRLLTTSIEGNTYDLNENLSALAIESRESEEVGP